MKKRKLESSAEVSPSSPNNVAATLASLSHAVLNAESICPISVLELLVDDFFTYIHPLAPFPHEPSFRAAFSSREDLKNPSFLALLASNGRCSRGLVSPSPPITLEGATPRASIPIFYEFS